MIDPFKKSAALELLEKLERETVFVLTRTRMTRQDVLAAESRVYGKSPVQHATLIYKWGTALNSYIEKCIGSMCIPEAFSFLNSFVDSIEVAMMLSALGGEVTFAGQQEAPTTRKDPAQAWLELSEKIVGHQTAKKAIKFAVDSMTENAELLKKFGRSTPKGLVLYGPPGTGKTMLARLAGDYIRARSENGKNADGFFVLEGVKDKWYGESEKAIRKAFENARAWSRENKAKAVLFIDEAEDLLATRGTKHVDLVPTFLAEMDNVDTTKTQYNPYVILASNRIGAIDEAVMRPGRIDSKIEVPLPANEEVVILFKLAFTEAPFSSGYSAEQAAQFMLDFAKTAVVVPMRNVMLSMRNPQEREVLSPFLRDLTLEGKLSGAVIVGVADQVKTFAIERIIEGGEEGITPADVEKAANCLLADAKQAPLRAVVDAEIVRVSREAASALRDDTLMKMTFAAGSGSGSGVLN